jgi:hypothetical protein
LNPIVHGSNVFGHERINLAARNIWLILERKHSTWPHLADFVARGAFHICHLKRIADFA